ncbi:hypothetical protein [Terrabacter sp. NPDC000476]|uniref:hypothetical protein n=1 Tax=Terrabacter sp. NPDC000476 TaxID=3154258 RepID=UPI003324018B
MGIFSRIGLLRRSRRAFLGALVAIPLLVVTTSLPANAAENVGVTVTKGSAAKLVVSPWAQNYRDTAYDNGPCSASVNMIMRASWSVDSVTSTSIHVNSLKLEFRTLWPMSLAGGFIGSTTYRSGSSSYTASTSTRTLIYNINRTYSWSSAGQLATRQNYTFDTKGLPAICGVGTMRSLVFTMIRG